MKSHKNNRRDFIKQATLAGVSIASVGAMGGCSYPDSAPNELGGGIKKMRV